MNNKRFYLFVILSLIFHLSLLFVNFKNVFAKVENNRELRFFVVNQSKKISKNVKRSKEFEKKIIDFDKKVNSNINEQKFSKDNEISMNKDFFQKDEILEFDFNDVRAPKIFNFNPSYPISLKKIGKTGFVDIKICVDVDGSMCGYEILFSSDRRFEKAVIDALMISRFEPAFINERRIKSYSKLRVRFELEE